MIQASKILPTYSADVFGVCSALFELGGMIIIHDPSGCNSTYTTHDEPRWFDTESMVYVSAFSELDGIFGYEDKLASQIIDAANKLKPKFIIIATTPLPTMTGFDSNAVAQIIENATGIPSFGISTTGMNPYINGVSKALSLLAEHFVNPTPVKSTEKTINIIGLTPLDFGINDFTRSLSGFFNKNGFRVISSWAMNSSLKKIYNASTASVNLVVSSGGIKAAEILNEKFDIPYVCGIPVGTHSKSLILNALNQAIHTGECSICSVERQKNADTIIIGEYLSSLSIANELKLRDNLDVTVINPLGNDSNLLQNGDLSIYGEEKLEEKISSSKTIIADPLFKPLCLNKEFIELPTVSLSGRMFLDDIPNLIDDFDDLANRIKKKGQ